LAQLLDTDRWSVRARVVRTLGSIQCPESVAALSRVLSDDDSATVRVEAANALGRQGREAAPALTRSATSDDDGDVRTAACRSLGQISGGSGAALPAACNTPPSSD